MKHITGELCTSKINVFESTQVALNFDFLSSMPASIEQSAFFIELAEELQLTFCEQIDNGCPVLLGMWTNILKAKYKLEECLQLWERQKNPLQFPKSFSSNTTDTVKSTDAKTDEEEILSLKSQTQISPCVVDSSLIISSGGQSFASDVYSEDVLSNSPHLYVVSGAVTQLHSPQLLQCAVANVKKIRQEPKKEENLIKSKVENSDIKEIYVDIAVNPLKTSKTKNKTTNHSLENPTDQHPLDKLCQLLCIDEDETIEKRLNEAEQKRNHELNLPYKYFCDQCSYKTKRETHLLKHTKLHEKIKDLFCCDQCDFKTIRESVLCRHKMSHASTQLLCKLCPYKTASRSFLLKHLQVRHGPSIKKKVKCNLCDYSAATPRELHKHKKIIHQPDCSTMFFKCSKCPYKSKLRAHLTRHDNDVHGSLRQFLCHYCGKSFKRNDTLTAHKIIHGEINKTFTCQHCGKVFTSAVFLREHLATHSMERPFLCDICGSSFKTRGATQRHKRAMHSGNKPVHSCSQCECTFNSRSDLNKHRKSHRLKAEATLVPAIISGANIQEEVISTPITIQVVYANQIDSINQDVTIK